MKDQLYAMFKELNDQLRQNGLYLNLICVGGFVLQHLGIRTTVDVDAFFDESREIRKIIWEIGHKYGLSDDEELWLNNSVQSMNPAPPEEICEILYQFSNLKVMMAPLLYVAGMKLSSAREQDIDDVSEIIKRLRIQSPEDLQQIFAEYGFKGIDESVVLEAFGKAYGMKWLEAYITENLEKILENLYS